MTGTTDFDYPPTQTVALGVALDAVESDLDDAKADLADLDDDAVDRVIRETRAGVSQAQRHVKALQWAVDQFGEEATVTLQAYTATTRARVTDTINRTHIGTVGPDETEVWLIAAGVEAAPWLSGGEDLQTTVEITGQLPPALTDWLADELDELNDLSAGN